MKRLPAVIAWALVSVSVVLGQDLISRSLANQTNKSDYAELNHIKYGLFSVEEWKRQITDILAEEINQLSLSKENRQELRHQIEVLLRRLADELYRKIRARNAASPVGRIKQALLETFLGEEDIRQDIPDYAEAIVQELTKSLTTGELKILLNRQVERYLTETYGTPDTTQMDRILRRTGAPDLAGARLALKREITAQHDRINREALLVVVLSVCLFAWSGFSRRPLTPFRYSLLALQLIVLLVAGVTTPMIDIEATIARMNFVLLGHPLHFANQVLYFRSKSILEVFWIMITHRDLAMKLVGILVITFSIVFPLGKAVASLGYYFDYRGCRASPVIGFLAFNSGKWSLADVMVVAILMAYIGFKGIIANVFEPLAAAGPELEISTTNGTALQPGYSLFLAYTLLAMFLSGMLTRVVPDAERQRPSTTFPRGEGE